MVRQSSFPATDANGRVKTTAYDQVGRLIAQMNEMNQKTSYTCDSFGNRLTLTDANGNVNRWTYDVFGRQTSMVFLSGDQVTYACTPWAV